MSDQITHSMKLLSTEDFWEEMCQPSFVRISLFCGCNSGRVLFTLHPPETIEGFLEQKINSVISFLASEQCDGKTYH